MKKGDGVFSLLVKDLLLKTSQNFKGEKPIGDTRTSQVKRHSGTSCEKHQKSIGIFSPQAAMEFFSMLQQGQIGGRCGVYARYHYTL